MAQARITRGDQVLEVDGLTAAAAAELAHRFADRVGGLVVHDGALLSLLDQERTFGFALPDDDTPSSSLTPHAGE